MDVSELDYELPPDLVAQRPPIERDGARLLVLDRDSGAIEHRQVRELPSLLRPSLLVVNDTRVLPARLLGRKAASGGRVELLLLERRPAIPPDERRERWLAMGRASKPLRPGAVVTLADGTLEARVLARADDGRLEIELTAEEPICQALERSGHVPLPPYIDRPDDDTDRERYQTVFANRLGAVAAPTAGLHFSERLLRELEEGGHERTQVTLHVGPGTFAPVKSARLEDHPMHVERYAIEEPAARAIEEARAVGRPVVAIGTTVVRTLESAIQPDGSVRVGEDETRILIQPPYRFRAVDALLTNFHLPRSTLLALVMAMAGVEETRRAYAAAVEARYRFFSYGDAMLIRDARARP